MNFAKYENRASAIVLIGSKFREILETPICTAKYMTTTSCAKRAPMKPGAPWVIVEIIIAMTPTASEGISAPRKRSRSVEEFVIPIPLDVLKVKL